MKKYKREDTKC